MVKLVNETLMLGRGSETYIYAFMLDTCKAERYRGLTLKNKTFAVETRNKLIQFQDVPGISNAKHNIIYSLAGSQVITFVYDINNLKRDPEYYDPKMIFILQACKIFRKTNIVVLINKMDTVKFCEEIYNQGVIKVKKLMKKSNFNCQEISKI